MQHGTRRRKIAAAKRMCSDLTSLVCPEEFRRRLGNIEATREKRAFSRLRRAQRVRVDHRVAMA
jgi:hypothetical protein